MQMNTDEAAMAQAATEFDGHSADLKSQLHEAEAEADGLVSRFRGHTGDTAQAQLVRYRETQTPLISELDSISQNIRESGQTYSSTDSDGASMLQSSFQV
ncbi:WXG100 family type VII secretion target [Mycobacteroides salmoniphilum]|uniref:ESAT-6-like protein n=1 Tax=Mycobacteroides salmoniphilum TaxID=404941 RepID=A0A4R8T049_9MYCO|nr:WXG100 family type VII secretion target [Mycobacteroides salmoniphilum]TEA09126.1 ESAT-6-like protein EsxB [Mycobacteroides salmoniphilum]